MDDFDADMRIKIRKQLNICDKFNRDTARTLDTPYTTIVHRDLWTNNIMIKRGKYSKLIFTLNNLFNIVCSVFRSNSQMVLATCPLK